jgi:hypothetical protein
MKNDNYPYLQPGISDELKNKYIKQITFMQLAISQPILQFGKSQTGCLFKKRQEQQLHLIPQSDICNTGGPHCLSCN